MHRARAAERRAAGDSTPSEEKEVWLWRSSLKPERGTLDVRERAAHPAAPPIAEHALLDDRRIIGWGAITALALAAIDDDLHSFDTLEALLELIVVLVREFAGNYVIDQLVATSKASIGIIIVCGRPISKRQHDPQVGLWLTPPTRTMMTKAAKARS
jgi:hypothetical protein